LAFQDASDAGALANLPPSQWEELNKTVADAARVNNRTTATRGNTASECVWAGVVDGSGWEW
jgi:hypothetical protein